MVNVVSASAYTVISISVVSEQVRLFVVMRLAITVWVNKVPLLYVCDGFTEVEKLLSPKLQAYVLPPMLVFVNEVIFGEQPVIVLTENPAIGLGRTETIAVMLSAQPEKVDEISLTVCVTMDCDPFVYVYKAPVLFEVSVGADVKRHKKLFAFCDTLLKLTVKGGQPTVGEATKLAVGTIFTDTVMLTESRQKALAVTSFTI